MPTRRAPERLKGAEARMKNAEEKLRSFIERPDRQCSSEEKAENKRLLEREADLVMTSKAWGWSARISPLGQMPPSTPPSLSGGRFCSPTAEQAQLAQLVRLEAQQH
jgi:hypothetical protein